MISNLTRCQLWMKQTNDDDDDDDNNNNKYVPHAVRLSVSVVLHQLANKSILKTSQYLFPS